MQVFSTVISGSLAVFFGAFTPESIWDLVLKEGAVFPLRLVRLDMCERSNCDKNKTPEQRSLMRGGFGSISLQPWSGSFAVRTQPTQQAVQISLMCSAWQPVAKRWLVNMGNMAPLLYSGLFLLHSCSVHRPSLWFIHSQLQDKMNFIDPNWGNSHITAAPSSARRRESGNIYVKCNIHTRLFTICTPFSAQYCTSDLVLRDWIAYASTKVPLDMLVLVLTRDTFCCCCHDPLPHWSTHMRQWRKGVRKSLWGRVLWPNNAQNKLVQVWNSA